MENPHNLTETFRTKTKTRNVFYICIFFTRKVSRTPEPVSSTNLKQASRFASLIHDIYSLERWRTVGRKTCAQ